MNVTCVTTEGELKSFDGILSVTTQTPIGEVCVLPGHAAYITLLAEGSLRIVTQTESFEATITNGLMDVVDDHITILTDQLKLK